MNISSKLTVAFGAFAAPVVVAALIVATHVRNIEFAVGEITGHAVPLNEAAHEMEINAVETGLAVMQYLRQPDPAFRRRIMDDQADFRSALAQFRGEARTEVQRRLADEVQAAYGELLALGIGVMDAREEKLAALEHFTATYARVEELLEEGARRADATAKRLLAQLNSKLGEMAFKLVASVTMEQRIGEHGPLPDLEAIGSIADHLRSHPPGGSDAAWLDDAFAEIEKIEATARHILTLDESITAGVENLIRVRQRVDTLLGDEIQRIATEVLGEAQAGVAQRVSAIYLALIVAGLLIALGGGAAVLILRRHITLPLADFASHLGLAHGDELEYSDRRRSHDEIGLIRVRYNQLARRLSRAREKLEGRKSDLETEIADRTRDLAEVVERLHDELRNSEELHVELRGAKAAADAANAAKSQFLANASHELRTPLNAIIGFSEMITHDMIRSDDVGKYKEYGRYIEDSGKHLLQIVDEILDLAKVEARQFEIDESEFHVDETIEDCLRLVAMRAKNHRVALLHPTADDLPLLVADRRIVKQIVLNLLVNGIKFSHANGAVTVSAKVDANGCIAIAVSDTGIGIAEKDIHAVMQPFVQAEAGHERRFEGMGLGLPIVKAFVERHGGKLVLASQPNVGTIVTVTFPAERTRWQRPAAAAEAG